MEDTSMEASPRKDPKIKNYTQRLRDKNQFNSKRTPVHFNSSGQTQSKPFNNNFVSNNTHNGARKNKANQEGNKKNMKLKKQREFFANKPYSTEEN